MIFSSLNILKRTKDREKRRQKRKKVETMERRECMM